MKINLTHAKGYVIAGDNIEAIVKLLKKLGEDDDFILKLSLNYMEFINKETLLGSKYWRGEYMIEFNK